MQIPFFSNILSVHITEAVFFTLLHSLWMGALMAVFAGVILLLTAKCKPGTRYCLLIFLMTIYVIATLLVFKYQLNENIQPGSIKGINEAGILTANTSVIKDNLTDLNLNDSYSALMEFFKVTSTFFVGLWILVIVWKGTRMLIDLQAIRKLKNESVSDPGEWWNRRINDLSEGIKLYRPVQLKLSLIATTPMVLGFLKPVILFPVALFNSLSEQETEAILLHELAHIRRQDFIINILQRFTEIIFFFNPTVYWVSELIRRERENCCDDLAIAVTKDKKQFIYALVAFQEHHLEQRQNKLATAFPGDKNQVFNRVNRILTNQNKSLNGMEKLFLASAIAVTCIVTFAFTMHDKNALNPAGHYQLKQRNTEQEGLNTKKTSGIQPAQAPSVTDRLVKDTVPETGTVKKTTTTHYITQFEGKKYEFSKQDGKIISLKIDGKIIPVNQVDLYQAQIDSIDKSIEKDNQLIEMKELELEQQKKNLHADHENLIEKSLMLEELAHLKANEALLFQKEINDEAQFYQEELLRHNSLVREELRKKSTTGITDDLIKLEADALLLQQLAGQQYRMNGEPGRMKLQEEMMLKEIPALMAEQQYLKSRNQLLNEMHLKDHLAAQKIAMQKQELAMKEHELALRSHSDITALIEELREEGIISDTRNLKMKLNNKELIINGKKQSAELHQRFLSRFSKKTGDKINFEYNITN